MSLEDQIKKALADSDSVTSEKILDIISQIRPHFRSELTSDYFLGKIQKITNEPDAAEKKKQCLTLLPYFDWYLQGL